MGPASWEQGGRVASARVPSASRPLGRRAGHNPAKLAAGRCGGQAGRGANATPATPPQAPDGTRVALGRSPMPDSRLNLLLAYGGWRDDTFASQLPPVLEPLGVRCVAARTACEADRVLRRDPVHIAVVDLAIPVDDSAEHAGPAGRARAGAPPPAGAAAAHGGGAAPAAVAAGPSPGARGRAGAGGVRGPRPALPAGINAVGASERAPAAITEIAGQAARPPEPSLVLRPGPIRQPRRYVT